MELKAQLDSLEGLDEQYHGLYQKGANGYHLQVADIEKHPSVAGIMSTLSKARSEVSKLKPRAESWDRIVELRGDEDLSPDSLHDALESAKPGEGDKDVEARIAEAERRAAERVETKLKREQGKLEEKLEKYGSALRSSTIDAELERAISEVGVAKELRPAVKALLEKSGPEMVESDGEFHGMFHKDPDGIPRDVTIAEYVKGWAQTDAAASFIESPGGGSGSSGSKNADIGGGGSKTVKAEDGVIVADPAAIVKGDLQVVG